MLLNLELKSYCGSCWDDSVEFSELSKGNIQSLIYCFVENHFDDGYSEFHPSYYKLSDSDYDQLIGGSPVVLNGLLELFLEGL